MVVHAGIEGGINIGGEEHCLWDGGPEAAQSVVLARTSKYFRKMSKMINMHVDAVSCSPGLILGMPLGLFILRMFISFE